MRASRDMRQLPLLAGVLLAVGMLLLAFYLAPWRGAVTPRQLPPELREEPDLHLEDVYIEQYQDDGALQYSLRAQRVLHFEHDHTRMAAPELLLFDPPNPPWRISAAQGQFVGRAGREELLLQGHVALRREADERFRFISVHTPLLRVYPAQRRVETDQDVIIETNAGRTVAQGLGGVLGQRFLTLQSDADASVKSVILPGGRLRP